MPIVSRSSLLDLVGGGQSWEEVVDLDDVDGHLMGGADVAAEFDAERASVQGARKAPGL